jgi:hypothetical protein
MKHIDAQYIDTQLMCFDIDDLPIASYCKNEKGMYTKCNKLFFQELLFKSAKEIIGKNDYAFLPEQLANRVSLNDKIIMKEGK